MAVQRISIQEFLQRSARQVLLDVRSPGEYKHAHIPGAQSLPLFTDEERKLVGTSYKQESREKAIKIGLDMFGPKMRPMVEEVEAKFNTINQDGGGKPVFVYCWRGGMRSAAVAWLLDLYGFKVFTLAGGYKTFRNYVLESFNHHFSFRILGGYTGSGKTEVLNQLEKDGEVVVDLERIACHKGSAFGSYKMPPQPSQEMFENILAMEVLEKSNHHASPGNPVTIWLEDESQRIGNLNLPNAFWNTMRNAPIFFLEVPFEERLNHIVTEYGSCERERLIDSVRRISKRLGPLETKLTIEFLEQGNQKEAFRILLHYYDKLYLKGLQSREKLASLITNIHCKTVGAENADLLKYHPV